MRWGLSVLDWHRHAIDDLRRHPNGCLKAECGHLLMMITPLDTEPYGRLCPPCAEQQFARASSAPIPPASR